MLQKYKGLSLQAKAAIWYTICNLVQKGISLIVVPIYTRLLTTDEYGMYTVFMSWLEIFEIIATFRLSWGGYTVGLMKYGEDRDRYSSSTLSLGFTITTVAFVIYNLIPGVINNITGMSYGTTCLSFILLYATSAISFWMARQRVEYQYKMVVTVTLITSILIPILGIIGIYISDDKAFAVIAARVIVQGIIGFILVVGTYSASRAFFNKKYWKRSLKFNVPLLPYYLSTVLLHSSDRIIIERLVGQAQAGIYGVAYSASMIMSLFNSSLNSSIQPWLFEKLKQKDYKDIPRIISMLLVCVAGLNGLLIAFAPEALTILAPKKYHEAVWIIPPLACSVFVMFFYQNFINLEFYFEESKVIATASIGAAILNIILNLMFIPLFGYLVAGYTTLICYLVFTFIHYMVMRRVCKKNQCPTNIFDVRKMFTIMLGFFLVVAVLMIGYTFWPIRLLFILATVVLLAWKRKNILSGIAFIRKK